MPTEYTVQRSWRKSVSMKIKDGRLYVYAPYFTTDAQIEKLVRSHQRWISNQLSRQNNNISYDLATDDHVFILGKRYDLQVRLGGNWKMTFAGDTVILQGRSMESVEKHFREYLVSLIEPHVEQIRSQLGLNFEVRYRYYKSRWGCCYHSKNLIVLNYLLGCVDEGCIREVICHEICHFKVHNHQKAFYAQLEKLCPDYRVWVKQLKKYAIT
ncbi:MAG: M48 family metallopeptidase [Erysipelotrichaceae bacterium]|nr:M48 family metallopeptidase [Erysipelotrichaceae bacterium]